ncbi:MAG TPA: hypothetical protein VF658_05975 [Pyrinomonadaceae bacterium]|jgi:hypothetical protein
MRKTVVVIFILFGLLCAVASIALGQAKAEQSSPLGAVAGHYEGFIKTSALGDVPISLDLRVDGKNLTGTMHTPFGDVNVIGGNYADGRLTIKMEVNGDEANFEGRLAEEKITGDFSGFGQTGKVELKRTGDAPPLVDTSVRLSLSKEAWREDLQYLAREIPRRHKNAFHSVTREQFERAVAELDAQIPNLDDTKIALGLSRIAAMIGDGHTRVNWHWSYQRVPLSLFWFGKELRVTRTVAAYRRALGARVAKIGGVSLDEALARALPFVHQGENEWYVKSESAGFLEYPALLYAIGLAPDATHAQYTFEDARGKRFKLDLQTLAADARDEWLDVASQPPLYRQRSNEPLWYTYLPETQTVYFNFKGYPSRDAFKKFAQDLFGFIDKNPVKRLVVDMRQNGGGDFTRGRDFIIPEVKKRAAINRRGHLFVITGRWTYSAGMVNAADFRKETNAILVGEPTGARPNGYQENRDFRLPNSRLNVWVSTEFYKFQEQETPGIMPDRRIDPDWASYRRGRDPVMEWILSTPAGE